MVLVTDDDQGSGQTLGVYLRNARRSLGLTLRAVEHKTDRAVTNGYLSQIENGTATKPSTHVLWALSEAYGLDYADLLKRAGIRVPAGAGTDRRGVVEGFPLDALAELTEDERAQLLEYIAFLRSRR